MKKIKNSDMKTRGDKRGGRKSKERYKNREKTWVRKNKKGDIIYNFFTE